ncbi:MAG: DMT family transporter [Erysipelotrichaceae bacterium]|nr:DMT family transporter [Erysipelotrichaceae bacterium]
MSNRKAHLSALFCIIVWGSAFVGTSILLESFSPSKLVFYRFLVGYLFVLLYNHKSLKMDLKDTLGMIPFGLVGVTIYYLCESYALNYTYAANVSILITFAPLLTILLNVLIHKNEKIKKQFISGSFVALIGVIMVIFNGKVVLKLSPVGDFLALGAAMCWALYSILLKYYSSKYDEILITRKVLFYGCLTLFPIAFLDKSPWNISLIFELKNLLLFIFLGGLASGVCYILWNIANVKIGIVAANIYVYVSPFVTLIAAYIFLHEPITLMSVIGCILIILGVAISEK